MILIDSPSLNCDIWSIAEAMISRLPSPSLYSLTAPMISPPVVLTPTWPPSPPSGPVVAPTRVTGPVARQVPGRQEVGICHGIRRKGKGLLWSKRKDSRYQLCQHPKQLSSLNLQVNNVIVKWLLRCMKVLGLRHKITQNLYSSCLSLGMVKTRSKILQISKPLLVLQLKPLVKRARTSENRPDKWSFCALWNQ